MGSSHETPPELRVGPVGTLIHQAFAPPAKVEPSNLASYGRSLLLATRIA